MQGVNPLDIFKNDFTTRSIKLLPYWRVRFLAPEADVERLYEAIVKIAPLEWGKTDRNAYRAAGGQEYYRPMQGAPTGAESETRKRPGIVEMWVAIPPDEVQLDAIVEAIYLFHSYYEPPITVESILRSQTRGLDDSDNPNRWWNNDGDWKKD